MRDGLTYAVAAFLCVVLFVAVVFGINKFFYDECRKDPDHTFWHCMQVLG